MLVEYNVQHDVKPVPDHISVAIIVSDFNADITGKLLEGAVQRLAALGVRQDKVQIVHVPGAVEIPLVAKLLAMQQAHRAIICLGAIIRGDTDHYQYVCQQVSNGCQQVMLEFRLPVIFGILTTNNHDQAVERATGLNNMGVAAANTAATMMHVVSALDSDAG